LTSRLRRTPSRSRRSSDTSRLPYRLAKSSFADAVITPLVNAAGGGGTNGLGFTVNGQLVDIGAFVSAIIYFVIFVAVVYFAIVVPYRHYARRRGVAAFSEPPPSKTCPACLSDGLPLEATKCRYCGTALTVAESGGPAEPA
jgi:large conductance mechanosensitive channel